MGGEVSLDSYIVSATSHGKLQPTYANGKWSRGKFARHHILFPDGSGELRVQFEAGNSYPSR